MASSLRANQIYSPLHSMFACCWIQEKQACYDYTLKLLHFYAVIPRITKGHAFLENRLLTANPVNRKWDLQSINRNNNEWRYASQHEEKRQLTEYVSCFGNIIMNWRMTYSGMWWRVALVETDVFSNISLLSSGWRISYIGTTLAVTNNWTCT
jgi:hypothetical protein